MDKTRSFYTPAEVAEMLGCDPQTVRLQCRAGTFVVTAVMIGNRVKIPKAAFDKVMGVSR